MCRMNFRIVLTLSTFLLVSITTAQQANTTSQQAATSIQQTSTTAVPTLIHYAGVLKVAHSAVISPATAGVTFAIYKQQDGGAPIWMETQNALPMLAAITVCSSAALRRPECQGPVLATRGALAGVQGQAATFTGPRS
jgi:hypothetical protein